MGDEHLLAGVRACQEWCRIIQKRRCSTEQMHEAYAVMLPYIREARTRGLI